VRITSSNVDDAVQITLFNAANPNGRARDEWIAFDDGLNAELAPYVVAGHNRIVLTHIDDNPVHRKLEDVVITVDGTALSECP
jgi:hypothetical protein